MAAIFRWALGPLIVLLTETNKLLSRIDGKLDNVLTLQTSILEELKKLTVEPPPEDPITGIGVKVNPPTPHAPH